MCVYVCVSAKCAHVCVTVRVCLCNYMLRDRYQQLETTGQDRTGVII